jgi:serine/threonine-protein kinase
MIVECAICKARIQAEQQYAGQFMPCPGCKTPMRVPRVFLEPGYELGNYRIEKMLGCGGMGDVFLATQISRSRLAAVKILPPSISSDDPEMIDQFMNEIRMTARFEHPNIVRVFEAGDANGYFFLAMEYIQGQDLDQILEKAKVMLQHDSVQICKSVGSALNYAWERGNLLHRDIKPSNIMIDKYGEAKLMDLGIAKCIVDSAPSETATGMVLGTPAYMSPEQARGRTDLDTRSDLYSLGATLYHLVTGQPPFDGPTPMDIMKAHLDAPIPSARAVNPKVTPECDMLIGNMLAKDRDERYGRWEEFLTDVDRVLAGQPPSQRGDAAKRTKLQKDASATPPPPKKRKPQQGGRKKAPRPKGPGKPKAPAAAAPSQKKAPRQGGRSKKKRKKIAAPAAEPAPAAAAAAPEPPPPPAKAESYTGIMVGFGLAILLILGGGAFMMKQKMDKQKANPPPVAGTRGGTATGETAGSTTPETAQPREETIEEKAAALRLFVEGNPDAVDEIPKRYDELIKKSKGTPVNAELTAELAAWEAALEGRVKDLLGTLGAAAEALARDGNLVEATAVLNNYEGPLAARTKSERTAAAMALAENFNRLAGSPDPTTPRGIEDDEKLQAIAERLNIAADPGDGSAYLGEWVKRVADELVAGRIWELPEYIAILERQVSTATLAQAKTGLDEMRRVATMRRRIYGAFKVAQGQDITVQMRSGPEKVKIVGISEAGIEMMSGSNFKTVPAEKLAYAEKLERLGDAMNPEIITMRGLVALEHGDLRRGLKAFESADTKLSKMLAGRTRTLMTEAAEASKTAQDAILAAYNIDRSALGSGTMPEEAPVAKEKLLDLKKDVRAYHVQHGKVDASADAFTNTLEKWIVLWQQVREAEPNEVELAKTPEQRFALLKEKLSLKNGSYLWKEDTISSYKAADGKVVELVLYVGKIQDISVVPAIMPDLKKLILLGYPTETRDRGGILKRALFNDLRPLRGLQLEYFACHYTEVNSLRPLSKMPLKAVDIRGCEVDNIEHLQDLPLQYVNLQHNPLFSLLPLQRKTTLRELNMGGTMVIDLTPVSTMTGLQRLHCQGCVFDSVSALKAMTLEELNLSDCRISDIEPLRGKTFKRFSIAGSRVSKFKILREIKTTFLDVSRTPFSDLKMLKDSPVTELIAKDTKLESLYDLRYTNIERLDVSETMIKGLRGIEKSKVTDLVARASFLREIKSIKDSPVIKLDISETKVDNMSPLIGSKVEILEFDRYNIIRDKKYLLKATSLLTLNGEDFPPK